MQFKIDGEQHDIDKTMVASRMRGRSPEPVQTHWVEVDGVRFPVKQTLEAVLGVGRTRFTSQVARSVFARLGLVTSVASTSLDHSRPSAAAVAGAQVTAEQAGAAFATLVAFLRSGSFTAGVSALEYNLVNADRTTVAAVAADAGLTEDLLRAALIVRRDVGRVSDVVHATVMSLLLPEILEAGEVVTNRPSLGAGNDSSRPYDLETNRRVAEFKVSMWSGGDMMRKRTLTADLVHLASDESGRRPELWVAGDEPVRFLRTSTSSVGELLSRSSHHLRDRYQSRYGSEPIALRTFLSQHAAQVELRNIAEVLPAIASALL